MRRLRARTHCGRHDFVFLMVSGADETHPVWRDTGCCSPLRHSGENATDGLPTELRTATAVANFLVEPGAISEEAAVPRTEEREESRGARDKEGNEETSSKARIALFGGFSVTDGRCLFSIHRRVRGQRRPRARRQRWGRLGRAAVGCCLDS